MPSFLLAPFNLAFHLLTPAYAIPIRRVSYMLRKYSLYKAAHRLARRIGYGTYSLKVLLFQLQHKALVYALFIGVDLLRSALIHVAPTLARFCPVLSYYALDLLDAFIDASAAELERSALLNDASSWAEYSHGGSALI